MRGAAKENTSPPRTAPIKIARLPAPSNAASKPTIAPIPMPTRATRIVLIINLVMLMVAVSSGIVIFAHGSSVRSANEAVRTVAQAAADAGNFAAVEVAFLEAQPGLDEAVARLAGRGVRQILVVPYFLTLGIHLQRDLPGMVERIAQVHRNVEIRCTPPLDGHPALIQILLDRVGEGLLEWEKEHSKF